METRLIENTYDQEKLNILHDKLLEIFLYVKSVCDDNDLEYALIAGSALGAIRHKGFIPWDDDLDIALKREDYNKLIKILRDDKDSIYFIQGIFNEEKYFLPFVKVRKKNTIFKEAMYPDIYKENGIFIDIFPLDDVIKPNSFIFKLRKLRLKFILHALMFRASRSYYKKNRPKFRYFIDFITSIPFYLFSNRKLLSLADRLIQKDNGKNAKYILNYATTYNWTRETFLKTTLFPTKKYMFEKNMVRSYNNINKYLNQMYGDYMKLPDENKRHSHEPIVLNFGE